MKHFREEQGITLVALVVTVIILLILAGVTVSLVVGQNGLLGRAQQASNTVANATANELKMMDEYDETLDKLVGSQIVEGNPTEWETNEEGDTLTKYLGNKKDIAIPNMLNGKKVTTIGRALFASNINIETLKISKGIIEIKDGAFIQCQNLRGDLVIPDTITRIGNNAFTDDTKITSLIIGEGVVEIGEEAFFGCSGLTGNLVIPNSVKKLGNSVFNGCMGLTGKLVIPNSINSLGTGCFQRCGSGTENGLNCVEVDLTIIPGNQDFSDIKCRKLIFGDNVTTIKSQAFINQKGLIGDVIIGNNVTDIEASAFTNCKNITKIDFGSGVRNIGQAAFYGCSNVNGELSIPNSTQNISPAAFYNCAGLSKITIPNSVTTIGEASFTNVPHIYYYGTATGSPWGALAIN